MERLRHDIRVGLRSLRQTPLFTTTAVLTLALGIGLSTAVFTVADAVLFRPLAIRDAPRVVFVAGATPDNRVDNYPISLDNAREFLRRSHTLTSGALSTYEGAIATPIVDGDKLTLVRRSLVSGDFFNVLGVTPLLGRGFRDVDDAEGAAPVAVLSHGAWMTRFGGAPDVIGRKFTFHQSGKTFTIVGVMPSGLDFPRGTDVWLPALAATSAKALPSFGFNILGRLAPNATLGAARGEMTAFLQRTGAPAWQRKLHGAVTPLPTLVLGDTRPAVLLFLAACALLLVITCTNVANLLLVRGVARVREMAVRAALGATRTRLVVQLLTEYLLLAVAGGMLGGGIAVAGVRAFVAFAPPQLPRLDEIRVGATPLMTGVAVTFLALLAFGLAPSFSISRADAQDAQDALRAGNRRTGSRRARRGAELVVAFQVATAMVVLAAAALIARSFVNLRNADLEIEPTHLLIADLALRAADFNTVQQETAMLNRLVPLVRGLPNVVAASPVVASPFSGPGGWSGSPSLEGQSPQEIAANPTLNMDVVVPDYFATMGMTLLRGRTFTNSDDATGAPVVVLSEAAARHFWGSENPIGKRVLMGAGARGPLTVVGIVSETRYRDLRQPQPSIYFPLAQSFFPFAPNSLAIRVRGEPSAIVSSLRAMLAERMPGVGLARAVPFESLLDAPLAQPRLNAVLLMVFAAAAGLLSAIGLFGVLATTVQQRRRELGIRMALGATAADVRRSVLLRGTRIGVIGAAVGLVVALWTNRNIAALLYGIDPGDLPTLLGVALALVLVSAFASYLPALTSSRVDPAIALRSE
ncbi:MAG TPA: ABC transporter permease [Gemmatimonadaceae bacterium]|jgi:predicted permease